MCVAIGELLGSDQILLADRLLAGTKRADARKRPGHGVGLEVLGAFEGAARARLIWIYR
jgi:hypothetical protein